MRNKRLLQGVIGELNRKTKTASLYLGIVFVLLALIGLTEMVPTSLWLAAIIPIFIVLLVCIYVFWRTRRYINE